MCGRFTLTETNPDVLAQTFNLGTVPADLPPRYNIAPTQPVATVVNNPHSGENELVIMRWGLVPSWAKDLSIGNQMINARYETAAEKPAFRSALSRRRCLVIADGFYEWKKDGADGKMPMYIALQGHPPFGFAGLWERWTEPASGEVISTCTILTGEPNELIAPIHNRMAIIVPRDDYEEWLDPAQTDAKQAAALLRPYPAGGMMVYPVSKRVNSPSYDGPELITRAG
ncbi:MAG TPA: SOS response-associated peptidase [Aggregatilineaceae bacterium]|nr:SOS response-associated peptidase [Aggregatilineaceae bacterium]